MPKLIFIIGATAAGKTHFISENYNLNFIEVLNVYDYQQRVYDEEGFSDAIPFGMRFQCLMRANSLLLEDIVEKLNRGCDVVVEHTLYKAKRRIAYIDEIRKIPDVTIEIYVICPSDEQWKLNIQERRLSGWFDGFKKQAEDIEFPNPAEGFDRIYEVVDGVIRPRLDAPRPEILGPAREELARESERIRLEDEEKRRHSEVLESMKKRRFWHYCEVCGKKEFITAEEAFHNGWDYPPDMGHFGLLGPRTCGDCMLVDTLYWRIMEKGGLPIVLEDDLSPEEQVTWSRIKNEPESLLSDKDI